MISLPAASLVQTGIALLLAPLLPSVIHRTKAVLAGRTGQPILQPYHDLRRLLWKGAVYGRTTTWIFRAAPIVSLAAMLTALALVPLGGVRAPLAFEGDLIVFAGLLAAARVATILGALDTGSSFEGMGASREAQIAALAEPALFLGLAAVAHETGSVSLSGMSAAISTDVWMHMGPAMCLVAATLLVVFLAENARMPVDDPNTHLELTMIHEVMILDAGGPDLAFFQYGAALKLWLLGSLLAGVLVPVHSGHAVLDVAAPAAGLMALAILTGVIESSMARLKLERVPQLVVGASALSVVAFLLTLG